MYIDGDIEIGFGFGIVRPSVSPCQGPSQGELVAGGVLRSDHRTSSRFDHTDHGGTEATVACGVNNNKDNHTQEILITSADDWADWEINQETAAQTPGENQMAGPFDRIGSGCQPNHMCACVCVCVCVRALAKSPPFRNPPTPALLPSPPG